jgi:hypothetical protein
MGFKFSAGLGLVCCLFLGIKGGSARADYLVYVAYAYDYSGPVPDPKGTMWPPSPYFPSPWDGDAGVARFAGDDMGAFYDAGALAIQNTGDSSMEIQDLEVENFEDGAVFQIWDAFLPFTLNPGEVIIFTQLGPGTFDTSDHPAHRGPARGGYASDITPLVTVTVDGEVTLFVDTGQVLNTGGFDLETEGNESHQWRLIGTFGGPPGTGIGP